MTPIKSLICFPILNLLILNVFAQSHKKFYDKTGKQTNDSAKAVYYAVYEKIGQDSDYRWFFAMYDMKKVPIKTGSYLDEDLSVAHGKFVYYKQLFGQHSIDASHSSPDTIIFKWQTGYFTNNAKDGTWLIYYPDGKTCQYCFYENGVLNGNYSSYYPDGKIHEQGNYINGKKEGDWYVFNSDSSIYSKAVYIHDYDESYKVYDRDVYRPAHVYYDFARHINKHLNDLHTTPVKGFIVISFIIDTQGNLVKPKITMGLNPDVNNVTLDELKLSPKWFAATLNKKPIEEKVMLTLNIDTTQ